MQSINIFLFVMFWKSSHALQCVDHNNNPVDWFVVYKLPAEHENPNNLITQGAAYTYMTANDDSGWQFSNISINNTNSLVGLTLEPLFSKRTETLSILYNDESPDGSINFKKGHTKGLILGDGESGIWLVHSVPRFPPIDADKYYYPHNGYNYGQNFLCISFDLNNLDKIGTQLKYNLPHIYFHNMPSNLLSQLPTLDDVIRNVVVEAAPWYHLQMLSSKNGVRFMSFAKSPKFAKELYIDWVAPTLSANLSVETWPNGGGRIPSECASYFSVFNVKSVSISTANITFKSTTDHSKWAVSTTNSAAKWICIGDINRATPQRRRGGGTVCFSMDAVNKVYQNSIAELENC